MFALYQYVISHFMDRPGAACLRYRNRSEITVPIKLASLPVQKLSCELCTSSTPATAEVIRASQASTVRNVADQTFALILCILVSDARIIHQCFFHGT